MKKILLLGFALVCMNIAYAAILFPCEIACQGFPTGSPGYNNCLCSGAGGCSIDPSCPGGGGTTPNWCGDGACNAGEDYVTCSVDCSVPTTPCCVADGALATTCGEGATCCTAGYVKTTGACCPSGWLYNDVTGTCFQPCGNGVCEDGLDGRPNYGENSVSCPADCSVVSNPVSCPGGTTWDGTACISTGPTCGSGNGATGSVGTFGVNQHILRVGSPSVTDLGSGNARATFVVRYDFEETVPAPPGRPSVASMNTGLSYSKLGSGTVTGITVTKTVTPNGANTPFCSSSGAQGPWNALPMSGATLYGNGDVTPVGPTVTCAGDTLTIEFTVSNAAGTTLRLTASNAEIGSLPAAQVTFTNTCGGQCGAAAGHPPSNPFGRGLNCAFLTGVPTGGYYCSDGFNVDDGNSASGYCCPSGQYWDSGTNSCLNTNQCNIPARCGEAGNPIPSMASYVADSTYCIGLNANDENIPVTPGACCYVGTKFGQSNYYSFSDASGVTTNNFFIY